MACCGGNCACSSGTENSTFEITTVDQTKCPLCGNENNCATEIAKANGQPEQPCWCRNETFSAELLATIPLPAQGKACVCHSCVTASY